MSLALRPFAAGLAMSVVLLSTSGCTRTRTDRVQEILVTADVSGVRLGGVTRAGGAGFFGDVELKLEQNGPKVTGQFRLASLSAARASAVEGTVAGDLFRFSASDGTRTGELQVDGDTMRLTVNFGPAATDQRAVTG